VKKTQVAGFILFLSLVVILAGFSNVSCAAPPAPTLKPIKIGWVDSLTGMYSTIGIPAKKGVDAYVTWLNKQGGIERHPIELTTYDNESDANKSILALKKAVEADSVHVVVGCSSTAISMAMAPAVGGSKVPFLSTTGTESFELANRKVGGDQHKWNFRPHAGNSIEKVLNIADYMKKKNINKIAFFSPETSFGKSNRDAALSGFPKCGIEVVLSDTYPGDATTFGRKHLKSS
jgi:branched-chain amino acid transport system substrate-binding protein